MATTIYLIRHGETEDADTRRYKGTINVPLSKSGIKQLERLAEYLYKNLKLKTQNSKLTAVYSSGLNRAFKSAEIIAAPFGLKPVIVDDLRERDFGSWEGMSFDEIKEKWPEAFNDWAENPLKFSPIGGESTIEVKERVMRAFNKIVAGHREEVIAIVSHGGITRIILCEMLGMPLENIFRIEQDFSALNIIELWDYPVIKLLNGKIE
jgi:alpha-ribazole phosphatase